MIHITFRTPNGGDDCVALLPSNFNLSNFRSVVPEKGDLIGYRLIIQDKQLCLDNENIFNRQKHLIVRGARILLLPRAPGGSFIEITLLKELLVEDLKNEVPKLDRVKRECDFCRCEELCAVIHCTSVCSDCFANYLDDSNFELRCTKHIPNFGLDQLRLRLVGRYSDNEIQSHYPGAFKGHPCGKLIDYRAFFKTTDFIDRWSVLCDVMDMIKNIDCQICYCGALLLNMTMYSKQQCSNCHRWLCFFCNRTWNDELMENKRYTCSDDDCEYQRRLVFELVPLEHNKAIMVPDRRCCPKCYIVGGYGAQCKYHSCPHCKHQFCFICLETENDCKAIYKSRHNHQCTSVKNQDYSMFPRMNEP